MTLTAARLRLLNELLGELADDPDVSLRLWPHIAPVREFVQVLADVRDAEPEVIGVPV